MKADKYFKRRNKIHKRLRKVCVAFDAYVEGAMGVRQYENDCSCGCKYFYPLECSPADWGVCVNEKSPRAGLLTFEHMGCGEFKEGRGEENKE